MQTIPADSGAAGMFRPFARAQEGGRVSTPETLYDYFINDIPDPDEAYRLEPRIRDIIRLHPDVQSAMLKRQKTVASMPDRFDANPAAADQKAAKKIADELTAIWAKIPKRNHFYWLMQAAVIDGGIGFEWEWHREATGHVRPTRWHPIHKTRVVWDRLGNMAMRTRGTPVYGSYVQLSPAVAEAAGTGLIPNRLMPAGKFMYHQHKLLPGSWDRPDLEGYMYYGLGEDVSLYYPVTFDVFVLQKRMKFIEKYSDPPLEIYYNPTQGFQESNRKIATSVRGESCVFIPKGPGKDGKNLNYEIVQRAVPTSSIDLHKDFQDGYSKRRIDAILLGDADETQKTEKGAYSDKTARADAGPQIWYRWDAANISGTINDQLVPAMARGLFPNLPDDYLPIHKLEPKEEKDRNQELEVIDKASKLVAIPKSYIYTASGIPAPTEGEETVGGEQQPAMPGADGEPAGEQQQEAEGAAGGNSPSAFGKSATSTTEMKPRTPIGGGLHAGRGAVANNGGDARRTFPRNQG